MMRILYVLFWASLGCSACSGHIPAPVIPTPVIPSVDLAVCVLDNYATATACRSSTTWVQCVATIANACGADAAAVERVLTSEKKARMADGVVVRP
jgi:hypothetical protein